MVIPEELKYLKIYQKLRTVKSCKKTQVSMPLSNKIVHWCGVNKCRTLHAKRNVTKTGYDKLWN